MVVVRTWDLGHGNPGLFYASRRNDGKESSSVVPVENRCDDRRQRTSEQVNNASRANSIRVCLRCSPVMPLDAAEVS